MTASSIDTDPFAGYTEDETNERNRFGESYQGYITRGWTPIPVGDGRVYGKSPVVRDTTGGNGKPLSITEAESYAGLDAVYNIGVWLEDAIIGIDVDHYGDKHGLDQIQEWADRFGPLPDTWMSTARPGTGSGIRFYRCTSGSSFIAAGAGVDIIQRGHRYAVVAPSVHPSTGSEYRWYNPNGEPSGTPPFVGDLAELPAGWCSGLNKPRMTRVRHDVQPDDEWAVTSLVEPYSDPCPYLAAALAGKISDLSGSTGRHDAMTSAVYYLVALGLVNRHKGLMTAVDRYRDAFADAVPERETADEFHRAFTGAAAKLTGQTVETADLCRCGPGAATKSTPTSPDDFVSPRDGLLAHRLRDAVLDQGPITTDEGQHLYAYVDGCWGPSGKRVVRDRCSGLLKDRYRWSHASAVVDMLSNRPPGLTEDSLDTAHLNLPNGLLRWETGQLLPHSPGVLSLNRLPVEWDPSAGCPKIDAWLHEVLPADALSFAYEVIGYTLFNGNPLHKAIMLYGRGRNGKGTFINLIDRLVGTTNTSSIAPQALGDNRFAAAELYGKLANLVGDVDPRIFRATETLKKLTGGDLVTAERKHQQPFQFRCRSLMIAAFNEMPRTADTTEGFFSRWTVLPFAGYFPEGHNRPGLIDSLATEAEMRGLLVQAIAGLQRVMQRQAFDNPGSVQEATTSFRDHADGVRSFIHECCANEYGGTHVGRTRADVFSAWRAWCDLNGVQPGSSGRFYERLAAAATSVYGRSVSQTRSRNVRMFEGIRVVSYPE